MTGIRTILHPTDFSESSATAFRLACALARDYGARLLVLHVKRPPPAVANEVGVAVIEPPEIRAALEAQLRTVRPDDPSLRVEHRLSEGGEVEEIVYAAHESACDLIVLGTHGRTGLTRLLLGSVAEQVLRRAPCPVLTVKTPTPTPAARADAKTVDVAPAILP